jgi:hypothetical protein
VRLNERLWSVVGERKFEGGERFICEPELGDTTHVPTISYLTCTFMETYHIKVPRLKHYHVGKVRWNRADTSQVGIRAEYGNRNPRPKRGRDVELDILGSSPSRSGFTKSGNIFEISTFVEAGRVRVTKEWIMGINNDVSLR